MKKILFTILLLISLFSCISESLVENSKFSGRVYSIVDSQKIYMKNVEVIFRGDTTITDIEGNFNFDNNHIGLYQIEFIYISYLNKLENVINEVSITEEDKYEEYLLFSVENKPVSINFPLDIGTEWIYYSYNKVTPPDGSAHKIYRSYNFHEILADTLFNGISYKQIKLTKYNIDTEVKTKSFYYYRLDKNHQIIYKYESDIEKENLLYPLYLRKDETLIYEIIGLQNFSYTYRSLCITCHSGFQFFWNTGIS